MSAAGDSRPSGRGRTAAGAVARRLARQGATRLERFLGGPLRTRVIVLMACVLALSSADTATVGASATQLRSALHISNTDIGLLVAVTSLVGAVASIPFGFMADRLPRTRTLGLAIFVWGVAMVWSATVSSFGRLLLARLLLGAVTAVAGPVVASLVGDYFTSGERGRIYSYILTGELLGAGLGFAVTGDIAALSWRAAFLILALPAFVLAWYVFRLPEPIRGGQHALSVTGDDGRARWAPEPGGGPPPGEPSWGSPAGGRGPEMDGQTGGGPASGGGPGAGGGPASGGGPGAGPTDAQRLAAARGISPDPEKVLGPEVQRLGLIASTRAVLRIQTNVILIVASACAYFYLTGVETFGVEFTKEQYGISQAVANLLLLVLGAGAVLGVLFSGGLSDRLLRRGFLNARVVVTAVAAGLTTVLFIPPLLTRSPTTALPYLTVAALLLSAQNPPIDAARLDIVPPLLWGRAEGIRTALRTAAQSLAPLLFGALADHVFGGGRTGLQWTFIVMLLPLGANAVILLRATRTYPRDVATAAATKVVAPPAPRPG